MNPYVARLKAYLADKAPEYGYTDARSLLEMLFYYYTLENPIDSGAIRCRMDQVNGYLRKLSVEDSSQLFDVITDMVTEHERTAFLQGIQVGARLMEELDT